LASLALERQEHRNFLVNRRSKPPFKVALRLIKDRTSLRQCQAQTDIKGRAAYLDLLTYPNGLRSMLRKSMLLSFNKCIMAKRLECQERMDTMARLLQLRLTT
jgi:hypothetical protein